MGSPAQQLLEETQGEDSCTRDFSSGWGRLWVSRALVQVTEKGSISLREFPALKQKGEMEQIVQTRVQGEKK